MYLNFTTLFKSPPRLTRMGSGNHNVTDCSFEVLKVLSQANNGKRVCYGDHLNILPRALKVQETYRGAMPLLKINFALYSVHGCR